MRDVCRDCIFIRYTTCVCVCVYREDVAMGMRHRVKRYRRAYDKSSNGLVTRGLFVFKRGIEMKTLAWPVMTALSARTSHSRMIMCITYVSYCDSAERR